jgi:hypothetical protein
VKVSGESSFFFPFNKVLPFLWLFELMISHQLLSFFFEIPTIIFFLCGNVSPLTR